jgi:4-alpha-glucanotransferase
LEHDVVSRPSIVPPAPLARRRAGVCMHFTSLPAPHGIGTLGGPAYAFVDLMVELGLSVWQFLPTGPTAYGDSPYSPLSVFAGNPLLIDLDLLRREGLLDEHELEPLRALPDDTVRYEQLIPLKLSLLDAAAQRFATHAGRAARDNYAEFVARERGAWLAEFALFESFKRRNHQQPWHLWDAGLRDRLPDALRAAAIPAADEIRRIAIVQFFFARQWAELQEYARAKGIYLFGDMPIYMAADCAEVWSGQRRLQLDASGVPESVAGVPPDYFSDEGQWWGNPLYRWEAHAAEGFAWWIERMRHACRHYDLVRLDHFRGFESYWAIPSTAHTAREGQWLPGPAHALFDALQAVLGTLPVVAEDLGMITAGVEQLRDHYGFPGMQVLQFMLEEQDFSLDRVLENCVCYTGTHDNDTALGWLSTGPLGLAGEQQRRSAIMKKINCEEHTLSKALIDLACRSDARLVVAPMQDFLGLGSVARMNVPGRAENNWRWRMLPGQATAEICTEMRDIVVRTGRA